MRPATLLLSLAVLTSAAAADQAANVVLGKTIFQQKAQCAACHGWAGDGRGIPEATGLAANLRTTFLNREQIIEVVNCGRPASGMPHFNAFAYTEDACYGMRDADIGKDKPPEPPRPLQPREIEAVVDYLMAKIVGKGPPTPADCRDYYGDAAKCE
jgi:mono/diheme cytochrome c family protein